MGFFLTKFNRVLFCFLFFCFFCFFFLANDFSFVSWTIIYAIYKFSGKNPKIVFRSNFLANIAPKGVFEQDLIEFFSSSFFNCKRFFHLFLGTLKYAIYKFHAKTPTLYSSQNSQQLGFRGIFEQYLLEFFFSSKIFFHSFLGPLYMRSTSFCAKTLPLYS